MTNDGQDLPEGEALLAAALAEYHDLRARQQQVEPEAFCRRHPDLAPDLEAAIAALEELEQVLEPADLAGPDEGLRAELPERLSGCKIVEEIGSGGMGRVFLALDERLGRKVAIKTLSRRYRDNLPLRTRFLEEARAMARLNHPHVARIYSLGPPEEEPHFVMEYVEGLPLTEAVEPLNLRQRAELIEKVARAVDFQHRHGVVHRDLKPANILVGPDLEPKVLDFGLALQVDEPGSQAAGRGEVAGTPAYFSPEQARGEVPLGPASDVFSLGAVFYEALTGVLPFRGETYAEQVHNLRTQDPVLPRRLNPAVPADLQNICLKALEKDPAQRYCSAREMANDLERFLAGEAVMASPSTYGRVVAGQIEQHLRDLEGWRHDQILSASEHDGFRKLYDRLIDREDAWIMEARRLSLPQVGLYFGAWVLGVGAALILLFRYAALSAPAAVLAVAAAAAATAWLGVRCWRSGQYRIAIAYLLAFCLLWPIFLLVGMNECGLLAAATRNREDLELFSKFTAFKRTTNAQLWWALLLSLPAYFALRRFTRATVFSLVFAVALALDCLVTLLRLGLLEWLEQDPGLVYLRLLPFALLFFAAAFSLERLGHLGDSRHFYPLAVLFTWASLSGVATFHQPYAQWLRRVAPWTRGQLEYLFILNAGIYIGLQSLCDRFPSAQMRTVAKAFRFVIPGHVLTSLFLLGLSATELWEKSPAEEGLRLEARLLELLLPAAAAGFVFGSIPKQMKNFFASGMLFLAVGVVRLQQNLLKDQMLWPLSLLLAGVLVMLFATHYAAIRMALARWFQRR